jgi:hypothetical protein
MSGQLTLPGSGSGSQAATVSQITAAQAGAVAKTGDTMTGNLIFSGSAIRIQGDFSNATVSNRTSFQSNIANGVTAVGLLPNGTATQSNLNVFNNSDPTNASVGYILCNSTEVQINSDKTGSGSYLPLTFLTNGAESARLDTSGNLLVGTTSANGLVNNLKKTVGGIFSTVNGSVSAANGNGTTLFTIPDVNSSMWIISVQLQAGDTANYSALAIVATQNGSVRFISNVAGALLTISQGLGLIIQATQSSGITSTIFYSAIRIM